MQKKDDFGIIRKNIEQIRENIRGALLNAGRESDDVCIVAASKNRAVAEIMEAYGLGISTFGENTAQELLSKYDDIKGKVDLHFIGQLQTNKVKYISDKVSLLQSLDREPLARRLQSVCGSVGIVINVLIEVNATGDEKRGGVPFSGLSNFYEYLALMPNIRTCGLMCVAPLGEDARPVFRRMRTAFDEIKDGYGGDGFNILSMGMSDDYMIAVEEGATMVRLGSALFGKRA